MVQAEKDGAMSFNLTHARHDPAHCLAPGLFQSLKKGDRKKHKLDVTYTFGEDRIEFSGPEPLGADDMLILQGLVAMSALGGDSGRGLILTPDTKTEEGEQLRLLLDLRWDSAEQDAMVVKGSFRQLAKELGYSADTGGAFKTIRESIERMWKVSIIVQRNGKRQGFRILSEYASDPSSGKLFVALNPRLAGAVVGDRPFTRINLAEVRALKTDAARLMHQRLCGWIDQGKSGKIGIDTLIRYIWPTACLPGAMRARSLRARNGLDELKSVGWLIDEYAKNKFDIARPII
jgi:hypothetical protein